MIFQARNDGRSTVVVALAVACLGWGVCLGADQSSTPLSSRIMTVRGGQRFKLSVPIAPGNTAYVQVAYPHWQGKRSHQYFFLGHANLNAYVLGDDRHIRDVLGGYHFARLKSEDLERTKDRFTVYFRVDPYPPAIDRGQELPEYQRVLIRIYTAAEERETIWHVRVVPY
jgi:hypothetical protein